MRSPRLLLFPLLLALAPLAAQAAPAPVDPRGIPAGTLLICGGGGLPEPVLERFAELAGGVAGRLVVIPTASARADREDAASRYADPWRELGLGRVTVLHAADRETAMRHEFAAPLRDATAVWFSGGAQQRLADRYRGTPVETEVLEVLRRGGVVGGSSAGAAIMSRRMIARGNPVAVIGRGFDLLPGAVIDQHFKARERLPRLRRVLAAEPGYFGLGIDEGTAVEVSGRRLRVLGESTATFLLAPGAGRDELLLELGAGDVADLVTWQRRARQRAGDLFPAPQPVDPRVSSGTVILAGGGRLPDAVIDRFIEAAGGPDAPIVVVPTAAGSRATGRPGFERVLARRGAKNLFVFHAAHPGEVAEADGLDFLRQAKGVWFGGGRQWRLVDAYEGTLALELFEDVLARGGVIGGSSAGCSIQAGYMVRGNPLGNREVMWEGYERGFGFLPGCAVDQHFFRRNRQADLESLVRRFPQVLGIGVAESTAIVVRGEVMEVVGDGRVVVYDRRAFTDEDADDRETPIVELKAGDRFDLVSGERVR